MPAPPEPNPLELMAKALDQSFADHPMGYWRVDAQAQVLAANEAYGRMAGLGREEIIGHSVMDLVVGVAKEEFQARFRQIRSNGGIRFHGQHRAADGLVFPVEIQLLLIPVLDQAIALFLKTGEALDPLAPDHREARFRRLVEQQGDGFMIVDEDERITFANAASSVIFGVAHGTLAGRCLHEFLDQEQLALVIDKTHERKIGKEDSYELPFTRADGERRRLFVTATRELDEAGRYLGSVGVFRDITQRRKADEDREKLIQELKQALVEVRKLSGLLPICAHCKKIRDDRGYWSQIEAYITQHSTAQFSHGICPDCFQEQFPEVPKNI